MIEAFLGIVGFYFVLRVKALLIYLDIYGFELKVFLWTFVPIIGDYVIFMSSGSSKFCNRLNTTLLSLLPKLKK